MKALFLSPHPDDVEIALGGLIHRYHQEGVEVHIALFTGEGDLHMVHSGSTVTYTTRLLEQGNAISCIAPDAHLHLLNLAAASTFDSIPLGIGVGALDNLLSSYHFDSVFIPMRSHNQDHNYVYEVAMAATRPGKVDHSNLYLYEQPTQFHGEQSHVCLGGRQYFALSQEHIDSKKAALRCHKSQMEGREHLLTGLRGPIMLAELRGLEIGLQYAEMCYLLRGIS